jgi:stage II sporulation protein E
MRTVTEPYGRVRFAADIIGRIKESRTAALLFSRNSYILLPASFLLARAEIAGGLMPFGFALFAAAGGLMPGRLLLAIAIILGMLTNSMPDQIYVTGASMLLFSVLSFPLKNSRNRTAFKFACLSFVCSLIPQITLVSLQGFLLYDLLKALFCSFIVFVLYFIFRNSLSLLSANSVKSALSSEEAISVAITAALVLSGIGSLALLGFSFKNILCIIMILFFSYKCGPGVGAAAGVSIGLIVSMSGGEAPVSIATYAFCGLLSGIFGNLGKIGSGLGFVMGNTVLAIYLGGEAFVYLKEILLSVGIFLVIPQKLLEAVTSPFKSVRGANGDKRGYSRRIRDITVGRLDKFSKAFKDLARTFGEISQTKIVTDKQDISVLFDRVADRICRDCSLCLHCWERNFYNTYQVMFKIVEGLEAKGRITESDIPPYFLERCERINDFVNEVNNMYELFKVDMVWKSRIGESRSLISQQFDGLSSIISGLAAEIDTDVSFMSSLEDRIYADLSAVGVKVKEVVAYENRMGKYEVNILHGGCGGARLCLSTVEKVVSAAVGRKMSRDSEECMKARDGSCSLGLIEVENLKIATGVARRPMSGSDVSGDSFTFMNTGNGKYVMALSDGMGSGYRASVQSKATVGMLESFLESGFDKDMAVNLINSILVMKSSEECFSTIDISLIDLFNGDVEFVKIGAAPTYVKRADRVEMLKSASLPAGILLNVDAELAHKTVDTGDMLIMVTDGVIDSFKGEEAGERLLLKLMQDIDSINPQQVADRILEIACENSGGKPEDDMTVIAAKVWKNPGVR